jgi:hypothetical protein
MQSVPHEMLNPASKASDMELQCWFGFATSTRWWYSSFLAGSWYSDEIPAARLRGGHPKPPRDFRSFNLRLKTSNLL